MLVANIKIEKPLKYQRRLGLLWYRPFQRNTLLLISSEQTLRLNSSDVRSCMKCTLLKYDVGSCTTLAFLGTVVKPSYSF